jgi:hypothetical protein
MKQNKAHLYWNEMIKETILKNPSLSGHIRLAYSVLFITVLASPGVTYADLVDLKES